jgi:benzoylformate decarboxylase
MTVMTGKEALMQILNIEEVEFVFGIPGATEVVFMDALEDHPEIKYILGLHETVAMGMAEGYARTSGKAGFLNFHTNTGLSASFPLLYNAYEGAVPLIVTAGQQDTRLAAREPALGADLVGLAKPFTKWSTEVVNVEDIPLVMRRAFKVALQPPQGPVFVALPQNLLEQKLDFIYSRGSLPFARLRPDSEAVHAAAGLLKHARNPVILVEDGVAKNAALAEVVELAELTGSRVYQQWMSDVNFPVNHPLYLGDLDVNSASCRQTLGEADVLVAIGTVLFSQAIHTPGPLLPPDIKIVQIDSDPWQIAKNYPVTAGLEGDIKVSVAELTSVLKNELSNREIVTIKKRSEAIAAEKRRIVETLRQKAQKEVDNLPIAASRLMQEIRDALKPGTRIVDDCWSYSAPLRQTLGFSEAKSYQRARGGGSIGWGLPGALGVKLASPNRPVVCISGDGSAMWSVQSLWTAAHYSIPVTYIICANGMYRQVRVMKNRIMGQSSSEGRYLGTDISTPKIDFVGLARSLGLTGTKVDRPGDLAAALKSAFNSPGPTLVEVTVDGSL